MVLVKCLGRQERLIAHALGRNMDGDDSRRCVAAGRIPSNMDVLKDWENERR
jgi:hypothetical protein